MKRCHAWGFLKNASQYAKLWGESDVSFNRRREWQFDFDADILDVRKFAYSKYCYWELRQLMWKCWSQWQDEPYIIWPQDEHRNKRRTKYIQIKWNYCGLYMPVGATCNKVKTDETWSSLQNAAAYVMHTLQNDVVIALKVCVQQWRGMKYRLPQKSAPAGLGTTGAPAVLWPEPQSALCRRFGAHSSDGSIKNFHCGRHKVMARVVTVNSRLRKLIHCLFIDVSAYPIVYYMVHWHCGL